MFFKKGRVIYMAIKTTAFGFTTYGGPEVFEEREIEIPFNEERNVLVKIERIGINPANAKVRTGELVFGKKTEGFQVIGGETQGEIVDLYAPVEGLEIGDKVIVKTITGSYAKMISAHDRNVYKIPEGMDLDFAAGFSSTATTAYWALNGGFMPLKEGQTLAVMGASGAVGSFAIQFAKKMNLKVIGVASARNEEYVKDLGADIFVDYKNEEEVNKYKDTADHVMDASLYGSGQKVAIELLKKGGTYLGLTFLPEGETDYNLVQLAVTPDMKSQVAMEYIFDFYTKYGLKLNIAYILPLTLEGVKESHRLITDKTKSGKIILSEYAK